MAFTDHCDVFGALDEEGVNRLLRHVMRQRPALFNYGTQAIADSLAKRPTRFPGRLPGRPPGLPQPLVCKPIDAAPIVRTRNNPVISVEKPIEVPGTDGMLLLNYVVQLTELHLDLHPSGVVTIPPELGGQLAAQQFALHAQACAGIGCPSKEFWETFQLPKRAERPIARLPANVAHRTALARRLPPGWGDIVGPRPDTIAPPREPQPAFVPIDHMECFCLDLFVAAHFAPAGNALDELLQPRVDGIEIVDVQPQGMENSVECLLRLVVQFVVLPKLSEAITAAVPKVLAKANELAAITLVPTPTPSTVPNNPNVAENKLSMFIDIEEVQP